MYTYPAKVWDLPIVQRPFSVAACPNPKRTFATFASLHGSLSACQPRHCLASHVEWHHAAVIVMPEPFQTPTWSPSLSLSLSAPWKCGESDDITSTAAPAASWRSRRVPIHAAGPCTAGLPPHTAVRHKGEREGVELRCGSWWRERGRRRGSPRFCFASEHCRYVVALHLPHEGLTAFRPLFPTQLRLVHQVCTSTHPHPTLSCQGFARP